MTIGSPFGTATITAINSAETLLVGASWVVVADIRVK